MKKFMLLLFVLLMSSCSVDYSPIDRNDYNDEEFNLLMDEINASTMDWISERQSKILKGDINRKCVSDICDFEKEDDLVLSLTKVVAIFPIYTSENGSMIEQFLVIVSNEDETQGGYIYYDNHVYGYSYIYENLSDYYYNEETNGVLNRMVVGDYIHGDKYWSLNVNVNGSVQNVQVYEISEYN